MTLDELRGLDKDDVLGWLGLQRQSQTNFLLGGLAFLGAGLALGAAVALLLAPKAGTELREDLRGRFKRVKANSEAVLAQESGA